MTRPAPPPCRHERSGGDPSLLAILWLIFFVLMFWLTGCSPARHLQLADKHIRKAIEKGAEIARDTTWHDVTFVSPEIQFSATIRPDWQVHNIQKPFVAEDEKTGARTEVTIDLKDDCSPDCIDTVYIETTVPAREETKKVPVKTETKISAGYTRWDLIILAIAACAVGAVASRLCWR